MGSSIFGGSGGNSQQAALISLAQQQQQQNYIAGQEAQVNAANSLKQTNAAASLQTQVSTDTWDVMRQFGQITALSMAGVPGGRGFSTSLK